MRISFFTFGCRTNQGETEEMIVQCQKMGWQCVPFGQPSEIVVVQTCTVTARSDIRVRALLRKIALEQPFARIVVAGCSVERDVEQLRQNASIALVVGNKDKHRIHELIASALPAIALSNATPPGTMLRTRPAIKIQEGCNSFCSYCIVPFVRGAPRSIPRETVLAQVSHLLDAGAKEIVLTGTHLGLYENGGCRIHHLVRQMAEIPGEFRIRISSLEPMGITDELIDLAAHHPKVCPHLHISFQSFTNEILAAMGRPYSAKDAGSLLIKTNAANPRLRIGCDLIVGFPGETEAMFHETSARVSDLPIHYGHVFRFSPRPGTKAFSLQGRVSKSDSIARSKRLRDLLEINHGAFVAAQIGKTATMLVEDKERKSGFTENYLRVRVQTAQDLERNRFFPVLLSEFLGEEVGASLVDHQVKDHP